MSQGIIMKSGIQYGGGKGSNTKIITQTEFDKLTTEEKNNGTIYLIDDESEE